MSEFPPPTGKPECPTCGHVVDEGTGWRPTQEFRVLPVEGVSDTLISHDFKRGFSKATTVLRTRTEQAWVRTWGEKEWRPES